MGKRKHHKDKDSHIRRKIRRLERRLQYPSDSSDCDYERRRDDSKSRSQDLSSERAPSCRDWSESDPEGLTTGPQLQSTVATPAAPANTKQPELNTALLSSDAPVLPISSSSAQPVIDPNITEVTPSLPEDILQALGDPEGKDEVFGPKILDEVAKRWGRVLVDGLTKEQKQEMLKKTLVPDNFRLVKAPLLNPEIAPVLNETVKNRDKLLEKAQNHLGLGIAGLTSLATDIIKGDLDKIEILKKLSEASQMFLDLHHENTMSRRKLITASLDKNFANVIMEVKRDNYLFGADLGDKIKANKTAEKSGLQIKRNDASASSSRKHSQQGNWRGPPRMQGQRTYKPGGQRSRYPPRQNRRPPPAADRAPAASKTSAKPRKQ